MSPAAGDDRLIVIIGPPLSVFTALRDLLWSRMALVTIFARFKRDVHICSLKSANQSVATRHPRSNDLNSQESIKRNYVLNDDNSRDFEPRATARKRSGSLFISLQETYPDLNTLKFIMFLIILLVVVVGCGKGD